MGPLPEARRRSDSIASAALATAVDAGADYTYQPPSPIAALITEGRQIWEALKTLRDHPIGTEDELASWVQAIAKRLGANPPTAASGASPP